MIRRVIAKRVAFAGGLSCVGFFLLTMKLPFTMEYLITSVSAWGERLPSRIRFRNCKERNSTISDDAATSTDGKVTDKFGQRQTRECRRAQTQRTPWTLSTSAADDGLETLEAFAPQGNRNKRKLGGVDAPWQMRPAKTPEADGFEASMADVWG